MSIWETPEDLSDAAQRLEDLSSLIEFATDLMGHGGPPIHKEYSFGERGYHGLFLFFSLIQEEMDRCQEVVFNSRKEGVR